MTAGTTVKRLLQRWALDTRRRLVDAWEEDFLAWDGKRQSEVDVLTSHFGYGVHLQPTYRISKRRPVKYFAFLRDPVERSMAQWRYMMRDEGLEGYSGMLRHQKFMKWWSKQIDMSTAFKLGTGGFSVRFLPSPSRGESSVGFAEIRVRARITSSPPRSLRETPFDPVNGLARRSLAVVTLLVKALTHVAAPMSVRVSCRLRESTWAVSLAPAGGRPAAHTSSVQVATESVSGAADDDESPG